MCVRGGGGVKFQILHSCIHMFHFVQGNHGELAHSSLLDILMNVSAVPENWKTGIINNVGG